MKMKCFGCGVEKDTEVKEMYPYKDNNFHHGAVAPLFVLECSDKLYQTTDWRMVVVCHECLHKLEADMWITQSCWEGLDPVVQFHSLPKLVSDLETKWNSETYSSIVVP